MEVSSAWDVGLVTQDATFTNDIAVDLDQDHKIRIGSPTISSGSGNPNGVVTASVGSMYTRTDGGAGTTLYIKESGSGNTGWVAK